jgi:hypothetical protein
MVIGQLHAPAALPQTKQSTVSTGEVLHEPRTNLNTTKIKEIFASVRIQKGWSDGRVEKTA